MKKVQFYTLFLLCCWAFAQNASAQATLSVQGTVQKSTGASVDDGDYSLTFKLYTAETGGTPVWSETQDPVNIIGGVYSVTLGTVTPLTAAFDQTYYLGISVGGGTELTPRARLTSSPYALSLIGQDNIFPSTGAVGAGTATPTAGYQLHVKAAIGDGKLLVEGENNAKIDLKQGANTVGITYDGSAIGVPGTVNMPGTINAGTINVTNFNPTNFSPANMAITSKLAVGQASVDANNVFKVTGDSYLGGYVEIGNSGVRTLSLGAFAFFNNSFTNGTIGYSGGSNQLVQLRVNGPILANGGSFLSTSDRRIKKDIHLSENIADLSTLRKLRVTDYRHIDEFESGSGFKKGFIAQEVETAFPEAISLTSEFIPNVYAASTSIKVVGGQMTVSLDKNHDFVVGDEVKLLMPDGEQKLTVTGVLSETTFSVNWIEAAPEKIFVYGKKVSDFHTVDYDRIFTLNVSATQELARRVEQLEAENASLRQRNDGLQQQNDGLRSDVSDIYKRLQSLEKKAGGNLEK